MTSNDKASVVLLALGIIMCVLCIVQGKNSLAICCLLVSIGAVIMIIANKRQRKELKSDRTKEKSEKGNSKNLLSDIFKPKVK